MPWRGSRGGVIGRRQLRRNQQRAVGADAEALGGQVVTNVIRHVGPTRVTVALDYGIDVLEVRVIDEGRRHAAGDDLAGPHLPAKHPTSNGTGSSAELGRGIAGMRERCQRLGGELTARSRPSGGFEVKARLPLAPTGTAH